MYNVYMYVICVNFTYFQTDVALMYDGVFLAALALHEVGKAKVVTTDKELSCSKSKSWADGISVLNYMKTVGLPEQFTFVTLSSYEQRQTFKIYFRRSSQPSHKRQESCKVEEL